jgi:hypothetical protein
MSNKAENIAEAVGQMIGYGLLAGALVFGVSACSGKKEEPKAAVSPTTVVNTAPNAAPVVVEKVKSNWHYGQNVDKMTGEVTKWAMANSLNKVSMKFPYNGGSEGTIIAFEKNVKLHFTKGQVMCSNYSGCMIQVKFDDEKPQFYAAVGPDNGQSNYVYVGVDDISGNGAKKFLTKLKTANRVMISVEMYQENSPVWEFNVSGFNPK